MKSFVALFVFPIFVTAQAKKPADFKNLEDLKKCAQENSYDTGYCFERFEKFVKKNPSQAWEAAKVGRTVFVQWAVLPTFEKGFSNAKTKIYCKDEDFQLSLFNSLGQSEDNKSYKIAQKFLVGECGPYLVDMAVKELDSYSGSSVIENLCPLLKKNGKSHKNCEPKVESTERVATEDKLPQLSKEKIKLGTIKAYKGPEGVKVVMAEVKGEKDIFLIQFLGIRGPWNNKTLVHRARQTNSNGGMDYSTEHNGRAWASIVVRNCYGGHCQTSLFAPEIGFSDGIVIFYDEQTSKTVDSHELMKGL